MNQLNCCHVRRKYEKNVDTMIIGFSFVAGEATAADLLLADCPRVGGQNAETKIYGG